MVIRQYLVACFFGDVPHSIHTLPTSTVVVIGGLVVCVPDGLDDVELLGLDPRLDNKAVVKLVDWPQAVVMNAAISSIATE